MILSFCLFWWECPSNFTDQHVQMILFSSLFVGLNAQVIILFKWQACLNDSLFIEKNIQVILSFYLPSCSNNSPSLSLFLSRYWSECPRDSHYLLTIIFKWLSRSLWSSLFTDWRFHVILTFTLLMRMFKWFYILLTSMFKWFYISLLSLQIRGFKWFFFLSLLMTMSIFIDQHVQMICSHSLLIRISKWFSLFYWTAFSNESLFLSNVK